VAPITPPLNFILILMVLFAALGGGETLRTIRMNRPESVMIRKARSPRRSPPNVGLDKVSIERHHQIADADFGPDLLLARKTSRCGGVRTPIADILVNRADVAGASTTSQQLYHLAFRWNLNPFVPAASSSRCPYGGL